MVIQAFSLNKEKDNIRSVYCKFSLLKTANHIAQVIFVLHGAMETHL